MTSITRLPTDCPVRPVSQPVITCDGDASMMKPNGAAFCHDDENVWPVRQMTPVYCTTTLSPLTTFGPVPCASVFVTSLDGGLAPLGIVTVGGSPGLTVGRLPPPDDTIFPVAAASAANARIMSTTNTSVSVGLTPAWLFPCLP